jgi:copper(I)-binding protein
MQVLKTVLAALLGAMLVQFTAVAGEVEVKDPWVREMPPVSKMTAAYMVVENDTDATQTLVRVESPDFDSVEMHRTVEEGGMARMVEQKRIPVAANGRLEMKPGGYHVMLMGYKRTLKAGDTVPLTLVFESGLRVAVSATVRRPEIGGDERHHHHHE